MKNKTPLVHHKRGKCKSIYNSLPINKEYKNTQCLLLHARNIGELNPEDHTGTDDTWLSLSAKRLGINQVCLYVNKSYKEIAYTDKIVEFAKYLQHCTYEYVLIVDSVDAVILNNPDDYICLLEYYGSCDIVYSTTPWRDHDQYTMPDRAKFNFEKFNTYLNSGVAIGRTDTFIQLFEKVLQYASFEPIPFYHTNYRKNNGYKKWSTEQLNKFPHGVSDDQTIIRYLVKDFWPHIMLDTDNILAVAR